MVSRHRRSSKYYGFRQYSHSVTLVCVSIKWAFDCLTEVGCRQHGFRQSGFREPIPLFGQIEWNDNKWQIMIPWIIWDQHRTDRTKQLSFHTINWKSHVSTNLAKRTILFNIIKHITKAFDSSRRHTIAKALRTILPYRVCRDFLAECNGTVGRTMAGAPYCRHNRG